MKMSFGKLAYIIIPAIIGVSLNFVIRDYFKVSADLTVHEVGLKSTDRSLHIIEIENATNLDANEIYLSAKLKHPIVDIRQDIDEPFSGIQGCDLDLVEGGKGESDLVGKFSKINNHEKRYFRIITAESDVMEKNKNFVTNISYDYYEGEPIPDVNYKQSNTLTPTLGKRYTLKIANRGPSRARNIIVNLAFDIPIQHFTVDRPDTPHIFNDDPTVSDFYVTEGGIEHNTAEGYLRQLWPNEIVTIQVWTAPPMTIPEESKVISGVSFSGQKESSNFSFLNSGISGIIFGLIVHRIFH